MNSDYIKVIELLLNGSVNLRDVAVTLAKSDPALFLRLAGVKEEASWHSTVMQLILNNERVNAIKIVREMTGLGLKNAKDVCDAVAGRLYGDGGPAYLSYGEGTNYFNLPIEQREVYYALLKARRHPA